MLVKLALGFLGIILFLFIFWKKLREDYSSEIIFQTAITSLVGLGLGLVVSGIILPAWFFWLGFLGAVVGLSLMLARFKLKFFETFEGFTLASIPMVTLMFFRDSISHSSLNSFLAFVACLILIFLAYWVDLNYKSFTWYKSGKIGFTGLFIAFLFFLIRTVIAILRLPVVSLVGTLEGVVSGLVALAFLGLLIKLGRKQE